MSGAFVPVALIRPMLSLVCSAWVFTSIRRFEEELYGDAILTALPMRLVKAGLLPGSVGFEPRGALWAAVGANGTEIQIINTHLGLPAYERMAQAKTLLGQNGNLTVTEIARRLGVAARTLHPHPPG